MRRIVFLFINRLLVSRRDVCGTIRCSFVLTQGWRTKVFECTSVFFPDSVGHRYLMEGKLVSQQHSSCRAV